MIQIEEVATQGSVTDWMSKWMNLTGVNKKIPDTTDEPFTPKGFNICLITTTPSRGNRMVLGGSMRNKKRNHHASLKPAVLKVREFKNCVPMNPTQPVSTELSVDMNFEIENMDPIKKKDIGDALSAQVHDLVYQSYRNSGNVPIER